MKIEDAAKILKLTGEITPEKTKAAYRAAAKLYHPDKGGSNEMMQIVNEAYEILKNYEGCIQIDEDDPGFEYAGILNEAINKIIHLPGIEIEVCGNWVWVTGNTKPHAKILGRKEGGAGFYYASKKKAWYFRPEEWKSSSRGSLTLDEIRDNYGSQSVRNKGNRTLEKTR